MEQKIFSKFNVYDQIGYLMVGGVGLLLLIFNNAYFYKISIPPFNLDNLLVWFIVAYFLGHFIQGIANLINSIKPLRFLVEEDKTDFKDEQKEVLRQAEKYFKLHKQDNDRLWNLCYMFTCAKDVTGQVQSFNSYYSMYRGWLVVFILESIFLTYLLVFAFHPCTLLLLVISVLFTVIFYKRSKRFWRYTRNKVLETFVVVKNLNL